MGFAISQINGFQKRLFYIDTNTHIEKAETGNDEATAAPIDSHTQANGAGRGRQAENLHDLKSQIENTMIANNN